MHMRKENDIGSLATLVSLLEEQATEILEMRHMAERAMSNSTFADYTAFRQKVVEFEMFSMIVEHRIQNMIGSHDGRLQYQLERLNIRVLNHLIGASVRFFEAMSGGNLPLGSRELFISELKALYDAKQQLSNISCATDLPEDAERNMRRAEKILREIIERAPSLLDFSRKPD
ncbi:hypothetical protein [Telmatospirillum sp. J64-1]|uniref:hypothetical protein n=1 Tax=Telmatospirillum sp. J64-1 TaxID=2502183 RepID=UPI00115ECF1C|nr:hypothetical protein [Telmatospirillum sp. J64-1]